MQSLKRRILELLEKDREFRNTLVGLIGYQTIMERLAEHDRKFNEIIEEIRGIKERLAEHDRKFNEIMARLAEHDRKFNEIIEEIRGIKERLAEHDRKFNEIIEEIRGIKERLAEHDRKFNEIMARLAEHDRKFNEIVSRMDRLEDEFRKLNLRVEVTLGSFGRRWGSDLEAMVLELFKEVLEKRGIEPGEVRKFRFKDEDGSFTGVRGRVVDVDVLVRDSGLYVIEVKSRVELEHAEFLSEKAKLVERLMGRGVDKVLIVAVNVDREAYERAGELGIDVICGHVVD